LKVRGVDVEVFPSPYDIPKCVRIQVGIDLFFKEVSLSIEYLGENELVDPVDSSGAVVLYLGRKTHRINRIDVSLDRLDWATKGLAKRCVESIQEAISRLKKQDVGSHRSSNYDLIGQMIGQFGEKIFGPMEAVESDISRVPPPR